MEWIINKAPPEDTELIYCTHYGTKFGYMRRYIWYYYDIDGCGEVYIERDRVVAWMPKPNMYEETTD